MNKGGFSWRRFVGISAAKARVSRKIGIPLTRSGRQRKIDFINIKALIHQLFMIETILHLKKKGIGVFMAVE
jgi:hypothetical protein